MQLQYDVRAEIVDYVPRILRLPCKQEDDDDYKGNGGGDHDEAGSRPATAFAQLDATFRSGVTRPLRWRKAQLDAMARMLSRMPPSSPVRYAPTWANPPRRPR